MNAGTDVPTDGVRITLPRAHEQACHGVQSRQNAFDQNIATVPVRFSPIRGVKWGHGTTALRLHRPMSSHVISVNADIDHAFSKRAWDEIVLVAGHGVRGDAHCGALVQHRSRVAKDPTQPNLRQVHLLHDELLSELRTKGYRVDPGQMGENITTHGLPLLALSEGTRLKFGSQAVLRVTGLRNPCAQIDTFHSGLFAAVLDRADDGTLVRKAGVMCIVEHSGKVRAGDAVTIIFQPDIHVPLRPV